LLHQITLRNFRSWKEFTWEAKPGLNFVIGPNARGKTSLLEALCFLFRLRSPKTHKPQELLRFGSDQMTLFADYGEERLGVQLTLSKNQHNKILERSLHLNGEKINKPQDYLQVGRIVWISLEDREIITGGSEKRRLYLDSAGLQADPGYRHALRSYYQALRSRNLLLRQQAAEAQVAAYNPLLIEHGNYLLKARKELACQLQEAAIRSCYIISGHDVEKLELIYQPGTKFPLEEALPNSQAQEQRLGYTCVGPHRDELKMLLNTLPAATFASEGQKRTIALSLKLGLACFLTESTKRPPLLLLDDIFGELDQERRTKLLEALPGSSDQGTEVPQCFLSTTEKNFLAIPPGATILEL
jgi:DNA replication and repair protein RecF